jgi:hypothetical protein
MTFLPSYYESIYGKMNNPTNLTSLGGEQAALMTPPDTGPSLLQLFAYVAFGSLVIGCVNYYAIKHSRRH